MQKIINIKHYKSVDHDRYVYIELNQKNEIIGLNFMQGCSEEEYKYFLEDYNKNNPELLSAWNDFNKYFGKFISSHNTLEVLNQFFFYYSII